MVICPVCKIKFKPPAIRKHIIQKSRFSKNHLEFYLKKINKKDNTFFWKGDEREKLISNYENVHKWLKNNFGKADKCENKYCVFQNLIKNKKLRYQWALKKEKNYRMNRKNFWMLCSGCHINYDLGKNLKEMYKEIKKYA